MCQYLQLRISFLPPKILIILEGKIQSPFHTDTSFQVSKLYYSN